MFGRMADRCYGRTASLDTITATSETRRVYFCKSSSFQKLNNGTFFSTYGTYASMYIEVLYTLLKAIVVFLYLIVGFAQSFYIMLRQQDDFKTFGKSLTTVLAMTIGELDYSNRFIVYDHKPFTVPSLI